jgi:hypothetical protein
LRRDTIFADENARGIVRNMMRHSPSLRAMVADFASNPNVRVTFATVLGELGMNRAGRASCEGLLALRCTATVDLLEIPWVNFALGDNTLSSVKPEDVFAHEIGHIDGIISPDRSGTEEYANAVEDLYRAEAGRPPRSARKPAK